MIAEFVLLMQFMWKYIDEFAGRGLSIFDFVELMFYNSVSLIPMAVPITILIASVMVYGNLAEKYELSSMKSAGISLFRIMSPGFMVAFLTFLFSLSVSNYFKPKAQLKFMKIFTAIRKKKPTLNIKEKIFNKDFSGVVIQTDKKSKNGHDIEKVKIYNIEDRNSERYNITTAERGEIFTTEDSRYFVMKLYNVTQYVEKRNLIGKNKHNSNFPLMRTTLDTLEKSFDISEFSNLSSGMFYKKRIDLLNSFQLMKEIEQNKKKATEKRKEIKTGFADLFENGATNNDEIKNNKPTKENPAFKKAKKRRNSHLKDNFKQIDSLQLDSISVFTNTFTKKIRGEIFRNTRDDIIFHKTKMTSVVNSIERLRKYRNYWTLGLHQQYSWALICVIFLFIGAPIGSIIRKGGYGYPILVTILFFMTFILLSISGVKFNDSGYFNPYFNAWLPVIFIFPISIFLTIKAIADTQFSRGTEIIKKIVNHLKKKKKTEPIES